MPIPVRLFCITIAKLSNSLLVPAGLVFVNGFLHFSVLQGPSSDQKGVARYKVEEEARKGSKGETVRVA